MYSDLNQYLILYADCIISEGYFNNVIYDFTRENNSNLIPKSYYEFIQECKSKSLKEVYNIYKDDKSILNEYIDFTIENEYGFLCDLSLKDSFPKINANINSPEYIDNCILELSSISSKYLEKLDLFFDELMVNSLEIRLDKIDFREFSILCESFNESCIESISIYIDQYNDLNKLEDIKLLLENYPRIQRVIFCNQNHNLENSFKVLTTINSLKELLQRTDTVIRNINLSYHFEAIKFNPYLYKKLFIDKKGRIKNAEELKTIANINEIETPEELIEIIKSEPFQKLWNSPKNKIQVCKDCEYQTVCFDTRIPQKVTDSTSYYFKDECVYNPYIGKTKGEEGYRPLAECGVISNENGFSIDHEKIAEINKELWEEEDVTD